LVPKHRTRLALAFCARGQDKIMRARHDRRGQFAEQITPIRAITIQKHNNIARRVRRSRTERAGPAITTPGIKHPRPRRLGFGAGLIHTAAIRHNNFANHRARQFANHPDDGRSFIQCWNHHRDPRISFHRLQRKPQFRQGVGGASLSNDARNCW
jgi:hypothetical protein